MRISTKLSAALFSVFIVLLAGAALVLKLDFKPAFHELEARQNDRDVARVRARLDTLRNEMVARVRDYAAWDDTLKFVTGRYPSYIADNFTGDWLANYNIDLALFLDDRGRTLWRSARTEDGRVQTVFDVSPLVDEARRALPETGQEASGVAWTELGPMLFVAMPSTRTSARGAPHGLVLFARRLNAAAFVEQVQIDVQVTDAAHAPRDVTGRFSSGDVTRWTANNRIATLIPLRSAQGTVVGAVVFSRSRDIMALGERFISVALALFAVLAAIACGVLWFLLRRCVVSPIAGLQRDFDRQSDLADIAPVTGADARNEVGALKRAYNRLVARLRESRDEAQDAQRERARAEAANQMKSEFLANMSHELRTPLNAIIGYVELTMDELGEAPLDVTRADLEKVAAAARHQLRLVNEVLDLARVEAGALTVEIDEFDGEHFIEEVARIVAPLAKSNANELRIEIEGDLGALASDSFRLKQCLINVAGNACKFTRDGVVCLSARRLADGDLDVVEIKVADTGVGMTPEQLAVLFEPFVQGDASVTRRYGGSGLGLAITRSVITLLGGTISVESTPGEGSVFTLTVPVGRRENEQAAPRSAVA